MATRIQGMTPDRALLGAGAQGLTTAAAQARRQRDGPNELPQGDRRHWLAIVVSVLREPMLLLLVGAVSLYLILGDSREAVILGLSVLLVILLTVVQEVRSERALQALRDLSSPRARVFRDGTLQTIDASDLVVDDVILVAEGERIPADACAIESDNLSIDESLLTGESAPVRRVAMAGAPRPENMLHAGSLAVGGHARARVTAIGAATEIGRIGASLRDIHPTRTPMQLEIRRAVWIFAAISLATSLLIIGLHLSVYGDWLQALLAGITLAIATIPEEFPVVLTVFLALGAWRMAQQRALVRRMPAIEALGAVTVLCTDKTGTLTENKMTVAELRSDGEHRPPAPVLPDSLRALLESAAQASPDHSYDPMERAIRDAANGLAEPTRQAGWERIRTYALSSELLATSHAWRVPSEPDLRIACKGAPEAIAALCGLTESRQRQVQSDVDEMARRGLRVLAVARAVWSGGTRTLPAEQRDFRFAWLGLIGLEDPIRAGVPAAVAEAQAAGIRVVMMTGDHLETARAIAASAGLAQRDAMLGTRLDALEGAEFERCAKTTDVFARVKPNHKLRLVQALKDAGEVVAMTGDGVNDAPALMAAHVGVAMGGRGTDVARESASIVLLDDNFVTIVRAIRQGRRIYDNIAKAVRYILAVHVPITGLALLPLLLGEPLVLLPLHVVFLELIIDPASTIVFERETAAPDIMQRPPRPPTKHMLDARTLIGALGFGFLSFLAVACTYLIGLWLALPSPQVAALAFTALIAGNLALLVINRGTRTHQAMTKNAAFLAVAAGALLLLATVTRLPAAGVWFKFEPPPLTVQTLAFLLPWLLLAGGGWTASAIGPGGAIARRRPFDAGQ